LKLCKAGLAAILVDLVIYVCGIVTVSGLCQLAGQADTRRLLVLFHRQLRRNHRSFSDSLRLWMETLAALCHVSIGFVLLGWIHPLLKLEFAQRKYFREP
jgi:hypothetical protein